MTRRSLLKSLLYSIFQPIPECGLFHTVAYGGEKMFCFNEGGRLLWAFLAWNQAERRIACIGIGGGIPWFGKVPELGAWDQTPTRRRWIGGHKVWDWRGKQ